MGIQSFSLKRRSKHRERTGRLGDALSHNWPNSLCGGGAGSPTVVHRGGL